MSAQASTGRSWRVPLRLAAVALTLCSAGVLAPAALATGPFVKLGAAMTEPRYAPAVGTLQDGKVLVSGGYQEGASAVTAELFDPATETFAKLSAAPTSERGEACYATLADGRILIAGGTDKAASLKTAEVFNPKTETFEAVGEMAVERDGCAAAALPGGKVLVMGGVGVNKTSNYKQAELFDPTTDSFESISAETSTELYEPAAVSLADGKVLLAGGYDETTNKTTSAAELFDPGSGKFEAAAHELAEAREELGSLPAFGGALLLGGDGSSSILSTVELFDAQSGAFEKLGSELTEGRDGDAAARLQNGSVLVLGGYRSGTYLASAEIAPRTLLATTAASTAPGTLAGTAVSEIPASAYFQYGTSTSYGSSTSAQALTPSPVATALGATLTALLPGTTYHYRLVAEDAGGPVYGADETFTTAPAPVIPILRAQPIPLISHAAESHSRWREGNKLASISRRKRPPVGTTFSFSLNEKATVSLTFTQRVSGRKVKGKCVAQTKANMHKHLCSRTIVVASRTFPGRAGADRISFQGRISAAKKLKPGTYTVTITASNAAGQRSAPRQLTFTIVR